ncbi:MAG TPA: AAA family ATPase [bacterium]|nr:AAA family ATPase [bacterium]
MSQEQQRYGALGGGDRPLVGDTVLGKDEMEEAEIQEGPVIVETETSVRYLGVKLEKAAKRDGVFVPKREQYVDYINDKELSLPMQRDIAVAFSGGDPIIMEGGTSLGKTTTVRKMAAELGWEVHYVNLNGATDVEDLMGRYIPNPHRKIMEESEYIFADGKVTSGLRQEEGKIKIIILDELNAANPNILIRLHEVLDALERGGEVVLSEDASEVVSVNKGRTKVIGLMNPPGKGYIGREALDPAQLRRWNYQKLPTELPKGTFTHATQSLFFKKQTEVANLTKDKYILSREQVLGEEQLEEIPGMVEIVKKYEEFHLGAKALLKNRSIATDQPQPFMYDDRMEPRRVRDFILRFYNGDITETMQQALRYYYVNKLENEVDKKKLEELVRLVEYTGPKGETKRKGLEEEGTTITSKKPAGVEKRKSEKSKLEQAKEIMGDQFYGPEEIANAFGFVVEKDKIPAIPYSRAELKKAKELGERLVLRISKDNDGKAMTMEHLGKLAQVRMSEDEGKLLYGDWSEAEEFFTKHSLETEWKLVGGNLLKNSTSKTYVEQTKVLRDYLKGIKALTEEEEAECSDENLARIADDAKKLAGLEINQKHRRSPGEVLYDWFLHFKKFKDRDYLEKNYDWTNIVSSGGGLVDLGALDSFGARVSGYYPGLHAANLGVVSVR